MNPSGRIPPFLGWFCFTWHLQRSCSPGSVVAFSPAAGRGCAGCPLKDMSPEPARPPLLASHRCACCTCEEGVFKSCDHVVVSHRHRALTVRKRGECSRWSDHTVKPLLLLLLFFTVFCFLHVLVYWRSSCLKNVTPPFLRRKAAEHFPWEASCILRVNSRILVPWEGVSSLQRWGVTCFLPEWWHSKKSSCVSEMQTAVIRDGFIQEGTTEGAGDLIPLMGAPILKILPGGTVRHEDESIHQLYCRSTGSSFHHFY